MASESFRGPSSLYGYTRVSHATAHRSVAHVAAVSHVGGRMPASAARCVRCVLSEICPSTSFSPASVAGLLVPLHHVGGQGQTWTDIMDDLSTARFTFDRVIRSCANVRDDVPTGAIKVWCPHQRQCYFSPQIFTWGTTNRYTPWIDASGSCRNASQQPVLTVLKSVYVILVLVLSLVMIKRQCT